MKKINLQYLAGFIDGEGCITIDKLTRKNKTNNKKCFKLSMSITNTYIKIIEEIHNQFGRYLIKLQEPKGCKKYKKVIWEQSHAVKMVKKLLPYLRLKRKQAKLLIAYWNYRQKPHCNKRTKSYYNNELKFINKMRILNKRGV
jgi:hypothetical protein